MPFSGPWASIAWGPYYLENEEERDGFHESQRHLFEEDRKITRCRRTGRRGRGGLVLSAAAILPAQTRQKEVAVKGAKVMPFDLERTTHVFQKLDDGGLQKVVVKDPIE